MILITTAGKVGSEAARLLTQQDEPVRVRPQLADNAAFGAIFAAAARPG